MEIKNNSFLLNNINHVKNLPKFLIYEKNLLDTRFYKEYIAFSTQDTSNNGIMICRKLKGRYYRNDYNGEMLGIDFIKSNHPGNGIGKTLINFAKNLSKKIECNGYIILKSDVSFTPNKIPHLFYRKQGFSTLEEKNDKKLDNFIKKNKDATNKDFPCLLMFYPPVEKNVTSFKEKIKQLFDRWNN